jgi:hypothetical protein
MDKGDSIKELIDLRVEIATHRRLAEEYRKLAERLRTRTDLLSLALVNVWQKLANTVEYKGKIDSDALNELSHVSDPRPMLVELLTEVMMLEEERERGTFGKRRRRARPSNNGRNHED